jgi:hypothetical protein
LDGSCVARVKTTRYEFNQITPCEDFVWRHSQVFEGAVQRWGRGRARLELGFGILALNESILIRKSAEHFAIDGENSHLPRDAAEPRAAVQTADAESERSEAGA